MKILNTLNSVAGAVCVAAVLLQCGVINSRAQYTYSMLNVPGAGDVYPAQAISGDDVAGYFFGSAGYQGYLYNINSKTYTVISMPGATETEPYGIYGNDVVGNTASSAFIYNIGSQTFSPLNYPGASSTTAQAISANYIVGNYNDGSGPTGYLYNIASQTFTTLPFLPAGVSGNNILGNTSSSAFAYNINSQAYTTFSVPGAIGTTAYGISGDNIVGGYYTTIGEFTGQGFLYNLDSQTFTTIDFPSAEYSALSTTAYGIDGNNIVGVSNVTYSGPNNAFSEVFLAVPVPEPATPALLIVGSVAFFALRYRRSIVGN